MTVLQHLTLMAGDSLVLNLQPNEFLGNTLGFLTSKCLTADELRFVELDKRRKTSHDRRDVGRQLITVEWEAYLEAQGVATAKSTGLDTCCHQLVPAHTDKLTVAVNLEAVLTRVARTADDDVTFVTTLRRRQLLERVERQFATGKAEYLLHHTFRFRALHGQLAESINVPRTDFSVPAVKILAHPFDVLVDVGGIDDKCVELFRTLIYQQVVHHAAVLVAHHAVENLAVLHG